MTVKVTRPAPPRLLTVDEWVQLPDADQYELIDGFLRARMVNQNQHEFAVLRVGYLLTHHLLPLGGGGRVLGPNKGYRGRGRRGLLDDLSVVVGENGNPPVARTAVNNR